MPSATFFNLPEEKRRRLIEAAWDEMTSVSFDKVSINRIIQNANISRGSFYQYFTDKNDLLHFLLEQIRGGLGDFFAGMGSERGDLFDACLSGYDWVMEKLADTSLRLPQLIRFAGINPELDLSGSIGLFCGKECPGMWQEQQWSVPFRKDGGLTAEDHLELLCAVVGDAVLQSFRCPEERLLIRERLKKRLMILKYGMLDRSAEGESDL